MVKLITTTLNAAQPYLEFDLDEVKDLRSCYLATIDTLLKDLPDVNWNSRLEVKDYFLSEHDLVLDSLKISELHSLVEFLDEDSDEYDVLSGLVEYLKLKYTVKNYLDCILRHEDNGKVYLRDVDGELRMPNKQPLSYSPDITDCLISQGE